MALGAPAAQADEALKMYRVTVDQESVETLGALGVDLGHTGYRPSEKTAQTIFVDLIDAQARAARADGLALQEVTPGPHVSEAQVEQRLEAAQRRSARAADKPETGGDSPNPFYDVFRSYAEPGGIQDEMESLAFSNPELAKLVVIGKSGRGQDIVALKVTQNARTVADGEKPAMLFSAVNHAREWIAAEVGRRMPTWWIEHADDPQIAELLRRNEFWFLPIQNPDGYEYTFTCGTGFGTSVNEMCGATLVTDPTSPLRGTYVYKTADGIVRAPNNAQPDPALRKPTNRLWRKTVRDNDGNGTFGDGQDGVDPNRNYPTAWGLDDEGSSPAPSNATFRGPFPLSETEDLAYDRLLRKITPEAVINYHSAAQLLLYPFGYITDVYSDDDPWFKAITGTDGDAAVDPYISQRSSDLYITNGETTDHAYNKYGTPSWTPELDECETAAGGTFCTGGSGFTFPDDEGKVEAVFQKNLDFARNVAVSVLDRDRPDRPRNATSDETQYQVKAAPDIEPNRFNVSYGATQTLEATARRILGPVDFVVEAEGPGGNDRTLTLRAQPWSGGERFGDLRGKFYQRVRAQIPADFVQPGTAQTPRPLVAGDEVEVVVIAGSQRQEFSYRVVSTRPAGNAKRVLVVAAEDYTGLSPNKTPYAADPRYLDEHVAALEANGYTVETYDIDDPPAGPEGTTPSKQLSDLGVLSHFDAVVYYTGDDLLPQADDGQGVDDTNYVPRWHRVRDRHVQPDGRGAPHHLGRAQRADAAQLHERGRQGRLLGPQRLGAADQHGHGPAELLRLQLVAGARVRLHLPAEPGGDDDRPHTAFFRELEISNDWGQWWLGVAARQGGPGTTTYNAAAVQPSTGGILNGMPALTLDTSIGAGDTLEPTQNAGSGAPEPRLKSPHRLRTISSARSRSGRSARSASRPTTPARPTREPGGAIISTRDSVSVGFGFEQITDTAARTELVRRMMGHLLPTGADTTGPTVSWLRPEQNATVGVADPVEIEVEAVDERGDIKEARLRVGNQLIQRRSSFPFQFRWQPTADWAGQTLSLVVEVEDKAGNVTRSFRTITVAGGGGTQRGGAGHGQRRRAR